MKIVIEKLLGNQNLTQKESQDVMFKIMSGKFDDAQIAGFLIALRSKGETSEEIAGFAEAMREKMTPIPIICDAIDMCGTGGDASGTFNISTAASFVVAGAGVSVAKHGNRSMSSKSGSADVLESLGVNITLPPERIAKCIDDIGLGFMFAPTLHPAMKHAVGARNSLAVRTVFNILGPLCNPAKVKRQVIGVFDGKITEKMATVLQLLHSEEAYILHGRDGLDEITTTSDTEVWEVRGGRIRNYSLAPEDGGIERTTLSEIQAKSVEEHQSLFVAALGDRECAARDIVLLNTGAALVVAGKAADLRSGVSTAREAISGGQALEKLDRLARLTQELE